MTKSLPPTFRPQSFGLKARLLKPGTIAVALLIGLFAVTPCRAQKTYLISYSPGATVHAIARERMKVAYKRAGLSVEFVPMPHKRSLQSANDGIVDGEAGRIEGMEKTYPGLVRVKVKVLDLLGAAYVLNESPITRYSKSRLKESKVCAVLGVQWAQDLLNGQSAEMVQDYDKLIGMLTEKRVDMILGSTLSVEAVLGKMGNKAKRIRRLNPPAFCQPLYHYVHKENAHIVPLLEQALQELWDEGNWTEAEADNLSP